MRKEHMLGMIIRGQMFKTSAWLDDEYDLLDITRLKSDILFPAHCDVIVDLSTGNILKDRNDIPIEHYMRLFYCTPYTEFHDIVLHTEEVYKVKLTQEPCTTQE